MSDFYRRLDEREAQERTARIFRNRPENLHDYQGCKADEAREQAEQPVISLLIRQAEIMPDGSLGVVAIGEFAGDREKDLRLTFAQAKTLVRELVSRGFGPQLDPASSEGKAQSPQTP